MLELTQRIEERTAYDCVISLDYDSRKRGRLKAITDSGESAGIFLQRGTVLLDGDFLRSEDGRTVIIRAAPEPLVEAKTDNSLIFAKTCYHLGNRHTPIEITELIVRFQPDHVLANMCRDWGLTVKNVERPFYPESGAYGKHAEHRHGH